MNEIIHDLYQFSTYIPPIDFTIHEYLLASDPAILFATGTFDKAKEIIPEIQKILGSRPLKYVFISHMESDEAGGLSAIKEAWPDITVLCGHLCARELPGYGYQGKIKAFKGGEELRNGDLDLEFLDYPSEVHLQNGLLAFERNSGIFYSSDLFLRFGNGTGKTLETSWEKEVNEIPEERVPNEKARVTLKKELLKIKPEYVAVGHGTVLRISPRD